MKRPLLQTLEKESPRTSSFSKGFKKETNPLA